MSKSVSSKKEPEKEKGFFKSLFDIKGNLKFLSQQSSDNKKMKTLENEFFKLNKKIRKFTHKVETRSTKPTDYPETREIIHKLDKRRKHIMRQISLLDEEGVAVEPSEEYEEAYDALHEKSKLGGRKSKKNRLKKKLGKYTRKHTRKHTRKTRN